MTQLKPPKIHARIPLAWEGIQVNFCKSPICQNFGVVPLERVSRGVLKGNRITDGYSVRGTGRRKFLECLLCNETPPLKSNRGIYDELQRILAPTRRPEVSCPNEVCPNHKIPLSAGSAGYSSFGTSSGGSKRYLCKACKKTFSVKTRATLRQRNSDMNAEILGLLVNKMPMRRICAKAKITPDLLYQRIGFLQKCAHALAAHYERSFLDGTFKRDRLYLSCDRQEYRINWSQQEDRRNVVLTAIGTADNDTGYIFGLHLNFDSSLNIKEVENDALAIGDYDLPPPHRKYARVWTKGDYRENVGLKKKKAPPSGDLAQDVSNAYATTVGDDIEQAEQFTTDERLPLKGAQIHGEYTLYAHFLYMRQILSSVDKVRFFVDRDSPMRAACVSAFHEKIKSRDTDVFFVRINKLLTVNEKRRFVAKAKKALAGAMVRFPGYTEREVSAEIIKEQFPVMRQFGHWNDRWMITPSPSMNEPEKAICHLTDFNDYADDHLANLYLRASLQGIDRFFMLIRRRLSLLERPIQTTSSGRVWYGYSPYNPTYVEQLLDVFRVYYNYCILGDGSKETAAMRLGLCDRPLTDEEFVDFF